MARRDRKRRDARAAEKVSCCRVESLISVDERGQMVLPKDIRERAGIRPGEKLAVISWEQSGTVCCISLVRAAALTEMVQGLLGPMAEQLSASRSELREGGKAR